ncbi:MAG TPA: hypothetical protein VHE78_04710 [Gemmatimonadaceae bacterium]|nr:hypothetical protein [Gemmatimonadaceae bacterium]
MTDAEAIVALDKAAAAGGGSPGIHVTYAPGGKIHVHPTRGGNVASMHEVNVTHSLGSDVHAALLRVLANAWSPSTEN